MDNKVLQNENIFIENLVDKFPEIKEDVLDRDYDGLITLQIGVLKTFTQEAIDSNDIFIIERCFNFVDDNLDKVVFKVENSLVLSYLAKLRFNQNPKAEKILPQRLKKLLIDISKANSSGSNKADDFLKKND